MSNKKAHWFMSSTGHMFYAVKVLKKWRFIGRNTYIIREFDQLAGLKRNVKSVFGFDYVGYM